MKVQACCLMLMLSIIGHSSSAQGESVRSLSKRTGTAKSVIIEARQYNYFAQYGLKCGSTLYLQDWAGTLIELKGHKYWIEIYDLPAVDKANGIELQGRVGVHAEMYRMAPKGKVFGEWFAMELRTRYMMSNEKNHPASHYEAKFLNNYQLMKKEKTWVGEPERFIGLGGGLGIGKKLTADYGPCFSPITRTCKELQDYEKNLLKAKVEQEKKKKIKQEKWEKAKAESQVRLQKQLIDVKINLVGIWSYKGKKNTRSLVEYLPDGTYERLEEDSRFVQNYRKHGGWEIKGNKLLLRGTNGSYDSWSLDFITSDKIVAHKTGRSSSRWEATKIKRSEITLPKEPFKPAACKIKDIGVPEKQIFLKVKEFYNKKSVHKNNYRIVGMSKPRVKQVSIDTFKLNISYRFEALKNPNQKGKDNATFTLKKSNNQFEITKMR